MSLSGLRRHDREEARRERCRAAAAVLRSYARRDAARDQLVVARIELIIAIAELLDCYGHGATPPPERGSSGALDTLLRTVETLPPAGADRNRLR